MNIVKLANAQLPIFYGPMRRDFLIKKKITPKFTLLPLKVSILE